MRSALVSLWLLALCAPAFGQTRTSVATDDFGGTLGNFTQINTNWGNMTITSGVVHGSNTGSDAGGEVQAAVWSGAGSFTDDQYASIVIGGLSFLNTSYSIGVTVRSTTDTNGARDYYQVLVTASSGGPTYTTIFSKVVNGTRTQLHSATATWSNGDRIELEAEGTTIRVMKNGTALGGSFTVTDSSLSTGKPGIAGAGSSGGATGDNWEGGNLGSSGSAVPIILQQH